MLDLAVGEEEIFYCQEQTFAQQHWVLHHIINKSCEVASHFSYSRPFFLDLYQREVIFSKMNYLVIDSLYSRRFVEDKCLVHYKRISFSPFFSTPRLIFLHSTFFHVSRSYSPSNILQYEKNIQFFSTYKNGVEKNLEKSHFFVVVVFFCCFGKVFHIKFMYALSSMVCLFCLLYGLKTLENWDFI